MRTESYSSLSSFKKCPRKYFYKYIEGREEIPSEAMARGKEIHEDITFERKDSAEVRYANLYRKKKSRLVHRSMQRATYVSPDRNIFMEYVEEKFGYDSNFANVDFEDKSGIYHGVVDYAKVYIDKAKLASEANFYACAKSIEIIDWKSGKSKSDKRQIENYALYFFNLFPHIDLITCRLVYIDQKEDESWIVNREEIEFIKKWILENKDIVDSTKEYPCKPSRLCDNCSYNQICLEERKKAEDTLLSFPSLV